MLHNIDTALQFLHYKKIKLVNIRSEDIVDGNPKLTLGLIWTIILHFQVGLILLHTTHAFYVVYIQKLAIIPSFKNKIQLFQEKHSNLVNRT